MIQFFTRMDRVRRRWTYAFLGFLLTLGIGIGTPPAAQALPWGQLLLRGVQILQLSNLSPRHEMQIGAQIDQQLQRQVRISNNRALTAYVNEIGQRLVNNTTRPTVNYTFQVVEDRSINAFATMGGFVYINRGLIEAAENEAELASVIAHEIGHIEGRHLVKQMREVAIAQGVATAAELDANRAVQIGVELALRRPRSRQDEYDADSRGLRLLGQAGYAQSAMVSFMEKLLNRGGSMPTFLSTHPNTRDRIDNLRRSINPTMATGDGLDSEAYRARLRSS
ncbi:M48 family metallopeptidase [Trichothermofontia sichuanensis B231]|uniref:M48 family metallopeptidase n=1 Tax=Trichothermofontia sichuanensis TaxID=3045816 RepID=UPI0022450F9B|nr:M48 family metallopeptidase [Trichothermofontia sichuanensis]UZQ54310.1 M48 family metallopeptidase [Trichothermofontia sichuanensis B231]